jgi:aryl-alcohol dehydrogenase-like predicted oxidoreductase
MEFGRTRHLSSRIIFGAYALSEATQAEADHVLELLLEYGINHIDTAQMYGNSEQLIGSWMKKHRDDFFIATKTRKRKYSGALADLQQSLKDLCIDRLDLWQMHGLTGSVGWETAMGPDGTLEAFKEARQLGLVRFLGVTGHGIKAPGMHTRSLERFVFDSVQVPYNYPLLQKPLYSADYERLISFCRERHVAIQTIKSIARAPWNNHQKTYHTYFYEPLESREAIDLAVHWVLGDPETFLISAGDMKLLPRVLDAASRYKERPSEQDMRSLVKEVGMSSIFS